MIEEHHCKICSSKLVILEHGDYGWCKHCRMSWNFFLKEEDYILSKQENNKGVFMTDEERDRKKDDIVSISNKIFFDDVKGKRICHIKWIDSDFYFVPIRMLQEDIMFGRNEEGRFTKERIKQRWSSWQYSDVPYKVKKVVDNVNDYLTKKKGTIFNKIIKYNSLYPNISIEDNNFDKFYKQRLKRGFDDTDLYSLDITIAKFILPRLKVFKKQYKETVVDETGMIKDINKMIKAFELVIRDDGIMIWTDKEIEQYKIGIEAFAKNFLSLWT